MPAITVARLSVTPVKGLALAHPDAIRLTASGAEGDRDLFLVDERDRLCSITRTGGLVGFAATWDREAGRLDLRHADGRRWEGEVRLGAPVGGAFYGSHVVPGRLVEGPWATVLSAAAGRPLRLVRADLPGAASDEQPVTLLGSASVAELERRAGAPVDPRRFRMLIDVATPEPHVEDTWEGGSLTGEEVVLRVGGAVPRCAAITRDPDRGDRDMPLVNVIRGYRGMQRIGGELGVPFGVYATVERPGTLRAGEELRLGG